MREPIAQFITIALLLFSANHLINGSESSRLTQQIDISKGQIQQIKERYRLVAGHSPTKTELHALVDDYISEEIFYREAMALGLDKNDTIVRRRMKQKLIFLAEETGDSIEPTVSDLENWFLSHQNEYRIPERLSFRHVVVSSDRRGGKTEQDARQVLDQLRSGVKPELLGEPSMIPSNLTLLTKARVSGIFGAAFSNLVFAANTNEWFGPISSPYGLHLVKVRDHEPSIQLDFDNIQDQLRSDWIEDKKDKAATNFLMRVRKNYQVNVEWPETSEVKGITSLSSQAQSHSVKSAR